MFKHKRQMQLFTALKLLEFVGTGVFSPCPKTASCNHHDVITANYYSNLTHAIATAKAQ